MPAEILKSALLRAIDGLQEPVLTLSRELHADPELSMHETRSSARIQKRLRSGGFEVSAGVAGLPTAFVATRRLQQPGPRIAFLAEYDALPEIGHACGHNLIAAAGVGAGLALAKLPGLPGEIRVIGTPAEETLGGKCIMVREGIFEGVDAAMMIHPGSEWRVEADSLACISLEVVYAGREAHAVAWPEKGINALDALIQLFISIDMLRKRLGQDVKVPGVILEGGTRPNIVPARAVGHFTVRAPTAEARDRVRGEFERVAGAIATATGSRCSIRATDEPYDELIVNRTLASVFGSHLEEMGIELVNGPRRNKGSLDMGNVSRTIPALHPFIAICDGNVASHSVAFAEAANSPRGEEALLIAVRALALTGLDLLTRPDLIEKVKAEFASTMAS